MRGGREVRGVRHICIPIADSMGWFPLHSHLITKFCLLGIILLYGLCLPQSASICILSPSSLLPYYTKFKTLSCSLLLCFSYASPMLLAQLSFLSDLIFLLCTMLPKCSLDPYLNSISGSYSPPQKSLSCLLSTD